MQRSPIRTALDGLYWITGALAGLSLVGICVLMMLLSIGREVGFNVKGADEISAWLCAATAYLGIAYTFKTGDLVRVGLLIDRLSPPVRHATEIVVLAAAACLTGYLAYYTLDMVWDSFRFHERTQGIISIPIWIPQLGLCVGGVVLFISVIDELVRVIGGARPCYEREPPKTVEETIERLSETV